MYEIDFGYIDLILNKYGDVLYDYLSALTTDNALSK